ncbi:hypothetical protein LWI29_013451 [Acer saccharum]|uniref:Uncharacterized protein n=1 Tax=Acer saccharum TaxID=4024 RepID=A0AA39SWI2_ACESA|nr:hypothetical protein LWI29_013451 [Acer saccharum]
MGDNAADRCPAMAGPHEQSYQEAARLDCSSIFCCKLASQWLADLSLQGPVVAINFLKERTPQARTKLYLISTVVWIQIG